MENARSSRLLVFQIYNGGDVNTKHELSFANNLFHDPCLVQRWQRLNYGLHIIGNTATSTGYDKEEHCVSHVYWFV